MGNRHRAVVRGTRPPGFCSHCTRPPPAHQQVQEILTPQRCVPSKVQEGQVQSQLPRDMEAAFLMMGSPACSALHPQRAPPFFGVTRRKCGPWLSQYRGEKGTGPPQEKTHKGPGGNITQQVIGSLGGGRGALQAFSPAWAWREHESPCPSGLEQMLGLLTLCHIPWG